jgi:DNA polymerase-3 subunit epsilon
MKLLGIDLESTGLDVRGDRMIEVGAVLWDTDRKVALRVYSEFVDPMIPIPEPITAITGITDDMVQEYGVSEGEALGEIERLIDQADYMVAHFGNLFDRPFLVGAYARQMSLAPTIDWIDTAVDIVFPERVKTRNLLHLAAEHGFLPGHSHRAVFDVMTMLRILSCYDLAVVIDRSKEPMVFLEACVSFEEKEKAKERGYRWCPPKKVWWRALKQSDAMVERSQCGFSTKILPEAPE